MEEFKSELKKAGATNVDMFASDGPEKNYKLHFQIGEKIFTVESACGGEILGGSYLTFDVINAKLVMPRYRVEERSGIVAVYDTEHPEYQDTEGCHSDYPWIVASWGGHYNKEAGHWDVEKWKIDKAKELVSRLNCAA